MGLDSQDAEVFGGASVGQDAGHRRSRFGRAAVIGLGWTEMQYEKPDHAAGAVRKTPGVAIDPPFDVAEPGYRRWALVFALIAGSLLVIMAVPTLASAIQPLDDRVWELAVANEYPLLVSVAKALAIAGGTAAMTILTLVGAVVLAWLRRWPALTSWLLVITLATFLNALVKSIYQRPRPPLGLTVENSWSFASGHSLTAAVVALMLVLVWVPAGPRRRLLLLVGGVYALVMAASRVYLRAHWLTDVVGGLAIGTAIALALMLLGRWWTLRTDG
jgi:undecaprenyl-diphosphatase